MSRIEAKFADLKSKKESAFVTFLMAGDPNLKDSQTIFKKLPISAVLFSKTPANGAFIINFDISYSALANAAFAVSRIVF